MKLTDMATTETLNLLVLHYRSFTTLWVFIQEFYLWLHKTRLLRSHEDPADTVLFQAEVSPSKMPKVKPHALPILFQSKDLIFMCHNLMRELLPDWLFRVLIWLMYIYGLDSRFIQCLLEILYISNSIAMKTCTLTSTHSQKESAMD